MLDWNGLRERVIVAGMEGITSGAAYVRDRAKEKAPVRKIFAGGHRVMRRKSISEAQGDRKMLLSIGRNAPPRSSLRHARSRFMQSVVKGDNANTPFDLPRRQLSGPGELAKPGAELTRRGRSELKTMRSAHQGAIGGRLQDEIYATEARREGSKIVAEVISPTEYGVYQEFGTRHNAAHPYMRPAAAESRDAVVSMIAEAVGRAAAAGLGSSAAIRMTIELGSE